MVFFTCNACGESLKKAQVDKHVNMCRMCAVLSCIDCGKDFWGNDYKNHDKCISEDQKYGGKGYEAKAKKGDVKQQQWIQKVHEAMNKPGIGAKLRDVLQKVSAYNNVPRKKAKFQNWMKCSLKIFNSDLHEEVWEILSAADTVPEVSQQTEQTEVKVHTNGAKDQNGHLEAEVKKKKLNKQERKEARKQKNGKTPEVAEKAAAQEPEEEDRGKKKKDRKRRRAFGEHGDGEQNTPNHENETSSKKTKVDEAVDVSDMAEDCEDHAVSKGKFNWKGNIKAVLRESSDQELSVKKLRKKVLAAYYSFTGDQNYKTQEEVLAIFNKKIHNNPKFRVLKERVKLVK
ncbi:cell growth-regulating nucleolar protein [Pholidichthys leucotaenia]